MTKAMRQKLLLDARIAGRSWREAAKIAGYRSVGSAYEAAQEAIANIPKEAADEARAIEMQRIDEVIRANWPRMSVGDPEAGNLILRAIDRRAKLLGLDLQEPTQVALDMTLQAVMLRLVAQEPEEVRAELAANLALLAADEEDDQRATSRNNHRNGKHAQAVSRALTG